MKRKKIDYNYVSPVPIYYCFSQINGCSFVVVAINIKIYSLGMGFNQNAH